MTIYISLMTLILIAMCVDSYMFEIKSREREIISRINYFIIFVICFIISAFRDISIGRDTHAYMQFFHKVDNYGIDKNAYYEKGYQYFNLLISYFTSNKQAILIVSSFVVLLTIFYFCYKRSNYKFLSIYLLFSLMFYYNSMNILRQYIAISIVIVAYKFVKERKFLKYLTTIILASSFHQSALFCLIMYFIPLFKLNKKNITCMIGVSIAAFLGFSLIFDFISIIFPSYKAYETIYEGKSLATFLEIIFYVILLITNISIIFFNRNKSNNNKNHNDNVILTYFMLIGVLVTFLSLKINLINRIAEFFLIFSIVGVPNVISSIRNKKNKLIVLIFVIGITFTYNMVIFVFRPEWQGVIPYKWIF